MPPEAKDVKNLMAGMVDWVNKNTELTCPIIAGVAHYQFASILIMMGVEEQQDY